MTISAHFDGKSIVPDSPLDLPVGAKLQIEVAVVSESESPHKWMLELATDLPDSPGDLSLQHDHYLYGVPKRP